MIASGSLLLAALFGTLLFAGTKGAILRSSGSVMVNGKSVPASTALFAGDKVSTASQGVATIMSAGSVLTLSSGSWLTYGAHLIEVGCGHLAVTALHRGLTAEVRNLRITPAADDSTYDVSNSGGKLTIGVRAGSALVDDGQQHMTVVAGKELTFTTTGECAGPPESANGNAAKTDPPRGFHMRNGNIALLGAAGAGATAAGVMIAEHGNKHCISPDGSSACKCSNTNPQKCQ
jgi:hypothetical protein